MVVLAVFPSSRPVTTMVVGGGSASDETKVVGSIESDAYGWVFFFRNDEAMVYGVVSWISWIYGGL